MGTSSTAAVSSQPQYSPGALPSREADEVGETHEDPFWAVKMGGHG